MQVGYSRLKYWCSASKSEYRRLTSAVTTVIDEVDAADDLAPGESAPAADEVVGLERE